MQAKGYRQICSFWSNLRICQNITFVMMSPLTKSASTRGVSQYIYCHRGA
jgi:hypothetical protein